MFEFHIFVLLPDQRSMELLTGIFEQMLAEMESSYKNKYELLRSYVQIIIHEALKIDPPDAHFKAVPECSGAGKTGGSMLRYRRIFKLGE